MRHAINDTNKINQKYPPPKQFYLIRRSVNEFFLPTSIDLIEFDNQMGVIIFSDNNCGEQLNKLVFRKKTKLACVCVVMASVILD